MPNLVSLSHVSLQILGKIQTGIFDSQNYGINKNCDRSRTRHDIDMKP